MYRNRLINRTERMSLAKPPDYGMSPGSFLLCPSSMFAARSAAQHAWQHFVYRVALEQAQAVVRPSLPERDLLAFWN
jgi:hypothetical protein